MSDTPIEILRVKSVHDHPKADLLEIVKVLNTQFISQKGDFRPDDLCIYFPPDMLIPEDVAETLGVKNYLKHAIYPGDLVKTQCRIGAIRLRSIPSYGFGIHLSTDLPLACRHVKEGQDVTKEFKGVKYQPPLKVRAGDYLPDIGAFHIYTNIQHYYRYADALEEGTPVRITEKIHGCLKYDTKITMADGSRKAINKIKIGDLVLGVNDSNQVVPTPVLNIFNHGNSGDWLQIQSTRRGAGRGNSFARLTCTSNHHFWSPEKRKYIQADKLQVGDKTVQIRNDISLSLIQEQIILGKLLGDGSLHFTEYTASLEWSHKDKELLEWTAQGLSNLVRNWRGSAISGYGTKMHRAGTLFNVEIKTKFGDFYTDRKVIPNWVADELTPLAIAFWYMDDGSLGHHKDQEDRAHFAVCGFTKEDCNVLIRGLKKYNINAVYYESENYSRLRLNANDAERLFLLIAPYITSSQQYKLPIRYRGHTGWLPINDSSYKPIMMEQIITSIESVSLTVRYDIETETHNYFANGFLTHNSNSRVGYIQVNDKMEFMCGTHKTRRAEFDSAGNRSLYWLPLDDKMKAMLEYISGTYTDERKNVIVYGEIFGHKIQSMDYGLDKAYFIFDIMVNGEYLDWIGVQQHGIDFGIDTVPCLYQGPFKQELIDQFISGPTQVTAADNIRCKFKGREGIVITPLEEEEYLDILGGRLILKAVSPDYYAEVK